MSSLPTLLLLALLAVTPGPTVKVDEVLRFLDLLDVELTVKELEQRELDLGFSIPDLKKATREHSELKKLIQSKHYKAWKRRRPKWRDEPRGASKLRLDRARESFRPKHRPLEDAEPGTPPETPSAAGVERVKYSTPAGELWAYQTQGKAGAKMPVVVWCHRGFEGLPAELGGEAFHAPWREEGVALFVPSWRGEHDNPGEFELCYGEVDDALAAIDAVAKLPWVDPERIVIGGAGIGGTIALLAAECAPKIQGAFVISSPLALERIVPREGFARVPYDPTDRDESYFRSPVRFTQGLDVDVLLVRARSPYQAGTLLFHGPSRSSFPARLRLVSVPVTHDRATRAVTPIIAHEVASNGFSARKSEELGDRFRAAWEERDPHARLDKKATYAWRPAKEWVIEEITNADVTSYPTPQLVLALEALLSAGLGTRPQGAAGTAKRKTIDELLARLEGKRLKDEERDAILQVLLLETFIVRDRELGARLVDPAKKVLRDRAGKSLVARALRHEAIAMIRSAQRGRMLKGIKKKVKLPALSTPDFADGLSVEEFAAVAALQRYRKPLEQAQFFSSVPDWVGAVETSWAVWHGLRYFPPTDVFRNLTVELETAFEQQLDSGAWPGGSGKADALQTFLALITLDRWTRDFEDAEWIATIPEGRWPD